MLSRVTWNLNLFTYLQSVDISAQEHLLLSSNPLALDKVNCDCFVASVETLYLICTLSTFLLKAFFRTTSQNHNCFWLYSWILLWIRNENILEKSSIQIQIRSSSLICRFLKAFNHVKSALLSWQMTFLFDFLSCHSKHPLRKFTPYYIFNLIKIN